ncbi:MAG: FAD-dependent oxidoreductase [Myxococcales bacterium]|nr:FAD-dependent oxidoreductase [Myxococcales bacterium]
MNHQSREQQLSNIRGTKDLWDVVVIGGGATGLGVALDASSRGLKTLLIERFDFTKGTSSRSTKLVHGGVRYLRQGQVSLVLEALKERGLLKKNAPHLVRPLRFVLPAFKWWERYFYTIGLKLYDLLARRLSFGKSVMLSKQEVSQAVSTLESSKLRGGVLYYDGQMDDARLGLALAKTAFREGATVLNYCEAIDFAYDEQGQVNQVTFKDHLASSHETQEYTIDTRSVVNATGVFVDELRLLEDQKQKPLIKPSQGAHLILPKSFLPGNSGIIFPETADGRVLFAIPWFDRALVGTTDHFKEKPESEPVPLESELQEILTLLKEHLRPAPENSDVLSVFAGLRPLVVPDRQQNSATISREHTVIFGQSGICHVTGGKWTTYRKMAEDVLEALSHRGFIPSSACQTEKLKLVGWQIEVDNIDHISIYGAERQQVNELSQTLSDGQEKLHPRLPYIQAEVIYAVRNEWAVTVEDVLSRRTRALLLDAQASIECAPLVAKLMAKELNHTQTWIDEQIVHYQKLAQAYLWPNS